MYDDDQEPIDITLEVEIFRQIVRPKLDEKTRAVHLAGQAFAAGVPGRWRNICGASREALATVLNHSGLRPFWVCFRPAESADLSRVTQLCRRITLVDDDSPWVGLFNELGIEEPLHPAWTYPLGSGRSIEQVLRFQAGLDTADPYIRRVIDFYAPLLDGDGGPEVIR